MLVDGQTRVYCVLPSLWIILIPIPQYQLGGFMINALSSPAISVSSSSLSSGRMKVLEWKSNWAPPQRFLI